MDDFSYIKKQLHNREIGILGSSQAMQSAVIVPLIYVDHQLSVLFEVRSKTLNKQPGEICFPGGKIDATDLNAEEAAKRELCEELGITHDHVEMVAPLDILVTPFRGIIYPFVGRVNTTDFTNLNKDEVDHIFTVPLSFLENYQPIRHKMRMKFEPSEDFPLEKIANKRSYSDRSSEFTETFYYYEQYVIWGLTARILTHFIDEIRKN
ncbi:NUDIX hydrolase [Halalkalibacter akibai]|uniref:Hypothetical nudix hydrolase YeaB n=1 Tax=Halalkalibacter akibai (strain ATCC 43226 / DSM 21942 / CIP 109018 / JCM 9157 / 1139) TaxID=1236973 RepID=W4QT27_HALA3|nr:CoA pyrophosphatase [Halalkalibacter akibai]GAE35052.1 hypothetical nudix hydrolase YeaB [Halalkalibacter akibai JCM 9157]